MANVCNWTRVLTFILFVFDSSLIKRSLRLQTLLTRVTRRFSLFQSSHMHSVYEFKPQSSGSSHMRGGDFIYPVCWINRHHTPLFFRSLFLYPPETSMDFTRSHNHPVGSLKCSHSQGRYCLPSCDRDPWCSAEALKKPAMLRSVRISLYVRHLLVNFSII